VALDAHPKQNIVAVSGNQQAVLLDVATGKWLGAFDFPEGDVTAIAQSQTGTSTEAACYLAADARSTERPDRF
jgi:hypothetical protein